MATASVCDDDLAWHLGSYSMSQQHAVAWGGSCRWALLSAQEFIDHTDLATTLKAGALGSLVHTVLEEPHKVEQAELIPQLALLGRSGRLNK